MSFHRKGRNTVDLSVVTMNNKNVKRWVEVVEHIFLDDAIDGRHWVPDLRTYHTKTSDSARCSKGPDSEEWVYPKL